MADVRLSMTPEKILRAVLSRENLCAILVCAALILFLIVTADQSPQWIYQGF